MIKNVNCLLTRAALKPHALPSPREREQQPSSALSPRGEGNGNCFKRSGVAFATRESIILFAAWMTLASAAFAVEINAENEKRSYLPLIPESTYTYAGEFKGRKSTDTLVLKTVHAADADVFYCVEEKSVRNPDAILGTTSIGLGTYIKAPDGIATLDTFLKFEVNALTKGRLAEAVTIVKNTPETGAVIVVPSPKKAMNHTYTVEGSEDVTVPAGTFKDCLKIKLEEIHLATPPEKNIVYSGTVWLARGVGVVKWIRGTGRVEELVSYKLAEAKKD